MKRNTATEEGGAAQVNMHNTGKNAEVIVIYSLNPA